MRVAALPFFVAAVAALVLDCTSDDARTNGVVDGECTPGETSPCGGGCQDTVVCDSNGQWVYPSGECCETSGDDGPDFPDAFAGGDANDADDGATEADGAESDALDEPRDAGTVDG